ncbi:S8 family peptidase [Streptomyces luteolifulvus]|uniref:S8 family peptidase n=1 Tax=Streptomyces luteolifulvus TaxID=2615112 RepID=UPI001CD9705E|nr:S8 family peptidase [Streptomyces luteolifulvus]
MTLLALALAAATPSALTGSASAASPSKAAAPDKAGMIAGQYIVMLKDASDRTEDMDEVLTAATAHASDMGALVRQVYRHALLGYSATMTAATAAELAKDPQVQAVQKDQKIRAMAQPVPTGVNRVDADLSPTAKIDGVDRRVNADVAVIDTGIDPNHPDLNVYRAGGKNCLSSFLPPRDLNGHGTHVAGTIGALDNNTGVVGVAPGVRLWPVQVLGPTGSGTTSSVVCGIDYVTQHADEIDVVNMSLGGSGSDDRNCGLSNGDVMHRAICNSVRAGVTYAVAAGNSHADAGGTVPAAYDEVITVSALADFDGKPGRQGRATCYDDQDDTFADFSNYGPDVDLIAPGVCILSTYFANRYATMSGTSMATPHVAGGAALYLATHPTASPAAVKAALQAAGNLNWTQTGDGDNVKERLLGVGGF